MSRSVMVIVLVAICVGATGCGLVLRDAYLNKAPTYADTKASWGKAPDGYGRVVILYPENIVNDSAGGLYGLRVKIDNNKVEGAVGSKAFIFVDLPVGKHSFGHGGGAMFAPKPVEFSIGEDITYIKFDRGYTLISKEEAEPLLEKMRHNYKKPLPFDKQQNTDRICY